MTFIVYSLSFPPPPPPPLFFFFFNFMGFLFNTDETGEWSEAGWVTSSLLPTEFPQVSSSVGAETNFMAGSSQEDTNKVRVADGSQLGDISSERNHGLTTALNAYQYNLPSSLIGTEGE